MERKYFYLGFFVGVLILVMLTALANDLIGLENPSTNRTQVETDNSADEEIIDRWENYPREDAVHGSRVNEKQVIVHQYIPQSDSQTERDSQSGIDYRRQKPNENGQSYDCRYRKDCRTEHSRRRNCDTYNCKGDGRYTDRYDPGPINDPRYRTHRPVLGWGEKIYHRAIRSQSDAPPEPKPREQIRERDCDWWNTGYRRLAEAGWHGSDEFECWN